MGIDPFTLLAIGGAISTGVQVVQSRKARKQAEAEARGQQATLEALQAQPAAQPEPVMPVPDDAAVRRARQRSIAAQLRRRGRASTILTSPPLSDTLGA